MIWASEYTFKTNFQNDFMEYPFFSEYNNKEDYKKEIGAKEKSKELIIADKKNKKLRNR